VYAQVGFRSRFSDLESLEVQKNNLLKASYSSSS
jgi:hypothetical protein